MLNLIFGREGCYMKPIKALLILVLIYAVLCCFSIKSFAETNITFAKTGL